MTYIPDPVELMESRMEREIDKIDADNNYPCMNCGEKFPVDQGICMSPLGDGPLVCSFKCAGFPDHNADGKGQTIS